jgi:spore maturation protein CgeB
MGTDTVFLRRADSKTPLARSARILLFDTTQHGAPRPFFLRELDDLSRENPDRIRHTFVDEADFLRRRSLSTRILTRTLDWATMNVQSRRCRVAAYKGAARLLRYRRHPVFSGALNSELMARARSFRPDVIIVMMGFHVAAGILGAMKDETGAVMVNYAFDDPFNSRLNTSELIRSIPHYDIYASTKRAIMSDVSRAGGRDVRYVRFGYKSSVHFPDPPVTAAERHRFCADVAFVGEGDADRVPFFASLSKAIPNLNLALYGGLWDRHRLLRRYFRGSVRGRDFRMALAGAKIVVNLVRRDNRDDHVMRTFEGPACGAFMLNERTEAHLELFREGREAAYFESTAELVDKVRHYLAQDNERERIRQAGYTRAVTGGHSYGHRLSEILEAALR